MTFPFLAMVSTAAKMESLSSLSKSPAPTIIAGFLAFEMVKQKG
jgi:hypothetical protein